MEYGKVGNEVGTDLKLEKRSASLVWRVLWRVASSVSRIEVGFPTPYDTRLFAHFLPLLMR